MKSLRTLLAEDPGFRSEGVLAADLSLPGLSGADSTRITAFFDRLLPSVRAIPGVTAAGVISALPIATGWPDSYFSLDGGTAFVGSTDYAVVDSLRGAGQAYGPRLLFGRRSVFVQWLKEDAPRKRSTVQCPWPTAPLFCARKAFRESSGWAKAWCAPSMGCPCRLRQANS